MLVAVALAGCGDEKPSKPQPTVNAADFLFEPRELRVPAGTEVTWTNTGATEHTVKGRGFFSRAFEPGETYRHRFATPGSFDYVCTLHPQQMRARVVVE
jgi:plastocyanin